jgi:DNA-binding CsgD family transcriptional regulator
MAATLRDRHYRAVLDLVGEVHDVNDLDEFREVLLPGLRRVVPAEFSSYNEIHERQGVLATVVVPGIPDELVGAWERTAATNPLIVRFVRTRDGRAYRFSDVVTRAELHALPVFQELYEPLGLEHQIAFTLPSPAPLTMGIALSRAPGGADFDDAERSMLDLARPHLIQAYRNAQIRERTTELLAAARTGMDDSARGMLMLDADRTLAFATAAALPLAASVLGVDALELGDVVAAPLAGPASGPDATALVPIDGDTVLLRRVRSGKLTVVLLEPSRRVLSASALQGLGLTEREAEVLVAVARGRSTDQAAEDLAVSRRTIHKHLQHVHAKLGVRDRAQAIATAWTAAEVSASAQAR